MVKASFEHEGNSGLLTLITHFNHTTTIPCEKRTDETFRLGGTAVNEAACYEGVILRLSSHPLFRAFRSPTSFFEASGELSIEEWDNSDLHCYVTEYYPLDMEGKSPGWFISKHPIKDSNHIFVNLDVLDGGGNIIKRYRVSPFTGQYRIING